MTYRHLSVTPRLLAHCRGEHDLYKEEIYLSPPNPRNQIEHHLQWTLRTTGGIQYKIYLVPLPKSVI